MLTKLATAIAELDLSPRADRLLACLRRREAATAGRLLTDPAQAEAWIEAALAAYRATPGQPAGIRRARVLAEFAARSLVADDGGPLAGSLGFNPAPRFFPDRARELNELGYAATSGHIVHDYRRLLARGVGGLREQLAAARPRNPAEQETARAFALTLDAFALWIRRHAAAVRPADPARADTLERLADQAPLTFPEALQLLWFAHVFLHAENPSVAISFGRLDQLLGPFLEADLERGRITLSEALDWLAAFFVACCEGEESQNAVLGGVDEAGRDATNAVSFLALRAMGLARTFQPSLVVRLHPGTPPAFLAAATGLAASGGGNPGFMNDPAVIPALERLGIPRGRARDWSIIGCYEAAPTGDCYPNTVLGGMHLPELLNQTLADSRADSFPAFLGEFLDRVRQHYASEVLPACEARWNHWAQHAPSPFGSLLMQGCLERLAHLETGAAPYNLAGINILGLGTVVDGLLAIRQRVFAEAGLTLAELHAAVARNFPDETRRRLLATTPGRYGTDHEDSNRLAAEVSQAIAETVLASRFGPGVRPYPAFFRFLADVHLTGQASPDGRRRGDLVSYGCGPARTAAATAQLNACAHVAHRLAACGNPVLLNLNPADCRGEEGRQRLEALLLTYFAAGGSHLHVNVMTADDLRAARENPQAHADLTVRVSGFSARFVKLDKAVQDALIARSETEGE